MGRPSDGRHSTWSAVRMASSRDSWGRLRVATVLCSTADPGDTGSSASRSTRRRTGMVASTWRPSMAAANAGTAR
jgi:hypothetical protein